MSAMPIGIPGCPEPAFSIMSMERNRIAFAKAESLLVMTCLYDLCYFIIVSFIMLRQLKNSVFGNIIDIAHYKARLFFVLASLHR
jgi:hypothetical protein